MLCSSSQPHTPTAPVPSLHYLRGCVFLVSWQWHTLLSAHPTPLNPLFQGPQSGSQHSVCICCKNAGLSLAHGWEEGAWGVYLCPDGLRVTKHICVNKFELYIHPSVSSFYNLSTKPERRFRAHAKLDPQMTGKSQDCLGRMARLLACWLSVTRLAPNPGSSSGWPWPRARSCPCTIGSMRAGPGTGLLRPLCLATP